MPSLASKMICYNFLYALHLARVVLMPVESEPIFHGPR
jgi:hypothetical protein